MFEAWTLAVLRLMNRASAISWLDQPAAISRRTSRSRSVRPSPPDGVGPSVPRHPSTGSRRRGAPAARAGRSPRAAARAPSRAAVARASASAARASARGPLSRRIAAAATEPRVGRRIRPADRARTPPRPSASREGSSRSSTRRASARQRAASAGCREGSAGGLDDGPGTPSIAAIRSTLLGDLAASGAAHPRARPRRRRVARSSRRRPPRPQARCRQASRGPDRASRPRPTRKPSMTAARASLASVLDRGQLGQRGEQRGSVLGPAGGLVSGARRRERLRGRRRGRRGTCRAGHAGSAAGSPARRSVACQAASQELVRLVPPPERDGRLRGDREEQSAIRPLDTERAGPLPARRRDVERFRRRDRRGRGARPGSLRRARSPRRRRARRRWQRPSRTRATPSSTRPSEREVPAKDPERERLVGRASRPPARRPPPPRPSAASRRTGRSTSGSRHGGPGCERATPTAAQPGRAVRPRRQPASAATRSPASHRYQRCRSWSGAARAGSASASTPARACRPEIDRRPVLPDHDRGLRRSHEDVDAVHEPSAPTGSTRSHSSSARR